MPGIFEHSNQYDKGKNIIDDAISVCKLDILVAAVCRDRMIFNVSEQEWDDVLSVHLKELFSVKASLIIL